MDSQKKSEPSKLLHEEALARRAGQMLDHRAPDVAGDCPAAEAIAAYHERALAPDEIALWEGHFATCANCRQALVALRASDEAQPDEKHLEHSAESVAAPGTRPVTVLTRREPMHRRARWVAPAIGIAAVLVIWFAMRPPSGLFKRPAQTVIVAEGPKSLPENFPAGYAPLPSPAADARNAIDKGVAAGGETGRAARIDGHIATESAEVSQENEKKQPAEEPDQERGNASAAVPALAPPVPPQQDRRESAKDDAGGRQRSPVPALQSEPAGVAKQSSAAQIYEKTEGADQTANKARVADRATKTRATDLVAPSAEVLARSPSGLVIWRAGAGGKIERSTDAGQSWNVQRSPLNQNWLAATAVSDTVCWLAGANGAIARSRDGKTWEPISPPATAADSEGKQPDWTALLAKDAARTTVVAADGRRYITTDGGKSWSENNSKE